MNFYPLTSFLVGLYNFIVGFFVLSRDKTNPSYRSYCLLCVCTGFWAMGAVGLCFIQSKMLALIIDKNIYAWGVFVPGVYASWIYRLLNKYDERKALIRTAHLISIVFLFFVLFTNYFIKEEVFRNTFVNYMTTPGVAYNIFIVFFYAVIFYVAFDLLKVYKNSEGKRKVQLRYIILSTFFGFAGTTNYFLIVYKPELLKYPSLGNLSLILYLSLMSYAIIKYQLLDIEVVIKKTLVFAGLLASVFTMLILPTLIIQEYLVRNAGIGVRLIGLAISGIIIILTMKRIETFLIDVTDKYLFQRKYDYKELLKTFTAEVLTVLDLNKLVKLTVNKLAEIAKLSSCAIYLFDEDKKIFSLTTSEDIANSADIAKNLVIDPTTESGYILQNNKLLIPMIHNNKAMGVLVLGKKRSDKEYAQDDLDILMPLARTLAIAISNAQLFIELEKMQMEATQKEKMATVGTLAAGMAHEIRNPITTIKIFTEYVPDKLEDSTFRSKYRDIVIKEVNKIDHVIQTLIDFSSDEVAAELEDVVLRDIIDELIATFSTKDDVRGRIELIKNIPANLSNIKVNRKEMDEILTNLTQNAVHAIKGRGRITFEASEGNGSVILSIKDTGCGIPEDILKNIFTPFFTTKEKGFGLGLFVVNKLVKRNNGKLSVESKVGEGTTFRLELKSSCT